MTTSNPVTNDPTSALRPNAPVAYTEGTQPLVLTTVEVRPKLLSRQRNSWFTSWQSSAC